MKRRTQLTLPLSWAALPHPDQAAEADLTAARRKLANRTRRIIFNNDGNDIFNNPKAGTAEGYLDQRTTPLAGSQVDAIFSCTGVFNLYSQRSSETELQLQGDQGEKAYSRELIQQGRDALELILDFGHRQRMEVFWSMRMNDTHDTFYAPLFCRWKNDYPDYLMGKRGDKLPYGGNRWSALNYGLAQVRDKVCRILQDVATRYDIDGLELDFFRHPAYFKPQMTGDPVTQEQCDLMTELLARVRKMTEDVAGRRGRPMLIAVRVPDSVGYSKAIGLDLKKWLDRDLIDIVTGSCYFHLEPWQNMVALVKPYHLPFYACLSGSRIACDSSYVYCCDGHADDWRGEALEAWHAGVSGIYVFNRFNARDPLFHQLGSPELLAKLPHTYRPNPGKEIETWLKGGEEFNKLGTH